MTDLKPFINVDQSELLNANVKLPGALGRGLIQSDADAELLFHLSFKNAVAINDFTLFGQPSQNLPSEVRLYNGFLSFDQVHSIRPQFSQACKWLAGVSKHSIPLNVFRSVGELTVFIPGNQDDSDETQFEGFGVYGRQVQAADTRNSTHKCG